MGLKKIRLKVEKKKLSFLTARPLTTPLKQLVQKQLINHRVTTSLTRLILTHATLIYLNRFDKRNNKSASVRQPLIHKTRNIKNLSHKWYTSFVNQIKMLPNHKLLFLKKQTTAYVTKILNQNTSTTSTLPLIKDVKTTLFAKKILLNRKYISILTNTNSTHLIRQYLITNTLKNTFIKNKAYINHVKKQKKNKIQNSNWGSIFTTAEEVYLGLGFKWSKKTQTQPLLSKLPNIFGEFWQEKINNENQSIISRQHHFNLNNLIIWRQLTDYTKLILTHHFPYKTHVVNMLAKTTLLTEKNMITSFANTKVWSNSDLEYKKINNNIYSFYFNDQRCKNTIKNQNHVVNDYYTQLESISTATEYCNATTYVLTKNLSKMKINNKNYLKLLKNYVATNRELSLMAFQEGTGSVIQKPTVFTYNTTTLNYLIQYNFSTMLGKYHYWNTTKLSNTLHVTNETLQNPFLFNWNENFWENTLYLQPIEVEHDAKNKSIDSKLLFLATTTLRQAEQSKHRPYQNKQIYKNLNFTINTKQTINNYLNTHTTSFNSKTELGVFKFLNIIVKKIINKHGLLFTTPRINHYFRRKKLKKIIIHLLQQLKTQFLKRRTLKSKQVRLNYVRFMFSKYWKMWYIKAFNAANINISRKQQQLRKVNKKITHVSKLTRLKKNQHYIFQKNMFKKYLNVTRLSTWSKNTTFLNTGFDLRNSIYVFRNLKKRKNFLFKNKNKNKNLNKAFRTLFSSVNVSDLLTPSIAFDDFITYYEEHISRNVVNSFITQKPLALHTYTTQKINATIQAPNTFKNDLANYLISNLFFLNQILTSKFLFKYVLIQLNSNLNNSSYSLMTNTMKTLLPSLELFYFGTRFEILKMTNLITTHVFNYTIKRRLLKLFIFRRFAPKIAVWYFNMLVRFMEFCTGRKVYLKLNPHIENSLTLADQIQCRLWEWRVMGFQKILGPKIFINESLRIILLALKYKDPTFLINWIRTMLYRMSFWKYRVLFRYLKFVIKDLFEPEFEKLGLKGFKLRLKGKISVAGNARTRTLRLKIGKTSHSRFSNKIAHSFTRVNSFTGVMGFHMWFFF